MPKERPGRQQAKPIRKRKTDLQGSRWKPQAQGRYEYEYMIHEAEDINQWTGAHRVGIGLLKARLQPQAICPNPLRKFIRG